MTAGHPLQVGLVSDRAKLSPIPSGGTSRLRGLRVGVIAEFGPEQAQVVVTEAVIG